MARMFVLMSVWLVSLAGTARAQELSETKPPSSTPKPGGRLQVATLRRAMTSAWNRLVADYSLSRTVRRSLRPGKGGLAASAVFVTAGLVLGEPLDGVLVDLAAYGAVYAALSILDPVFALTGPGYVLWWIGKMYLTDRIGTPVASWLRRKLGIPPSVWDTPAAGPAAPPTRGLAEIIDEVGK